MLLKRQLLAAIFQVDKLLIKISINITTKYDKHRERGALMTYNQLPRVGYPQSFKVTEMSKTREQPNSVPILIHRICFLPCFSSMFPTLKYTNTHPLLIFYHFAFYLLRYFSPQPLQELLFIPEADTTVNLSKALDHQQVSSSKEGHSWERLQWKNKQAFF